jgi:hypothetical protein
MRFLALLLMMAAVCRADFANDQNVDQSDILLRIITSAGKDKRFTSRAGDEALYLRKAEYIGPLNAPFGTVHVAQLFYIRPSPHGSKSPARGHTFIVFLDEHFKIRSYWTPDLPENLSVAGNKLLLDGAVVLDYSHVPEHGQIVVDGKVEGLPQWKK